MSLTQLLLVDDSEAVLAYEKAALAGDFALTTASDGVEALQRMAEQRPAAVLLDLSMPRMSGDEVLARLLGDPALKAVPVIIVSSEVERGRACVQKGAAGFLPKPVKADELRRLVHAVLAKARQRALQGSLAALLLSLGPRTFGVPLGAVRIVVLQPRTHVRATGRSLDMEFVDFHGTPVPVLDLSGPLGVSRSVPLVDRQLVLLQEGDRLLALSVDRVQDPEEFPPESVQRRGQVPGESKAHTVLALVNRAGEWVPILEPTAPWSPSLPRELAAVLESVAAGGAGDAFRVC